ncbi:MAG: sensor histidine kinase [Desulfovibrio sp.]|nr:MAG: sensor histidine kinase [Desulfovibrio sp.]
MKQWILRVVIFVLLSLGLLAGQFMLSALLSTGSLHPPSGPGEQHGNLAQWGERLLAVEQSVDSHSAQERQGLEQELSEQGVEVWVVDSLGQDISGKEAPDSVLGLAHTALASGGRIMVESEHDSGRTWAATEFTGSGGVQYVAVGSFARHDSPPQPPRFRHASLALSVACAALLLYFLLRGKFGLARDMRKAFRRMAQGDVSVRLTPENTGARDEYQTLAKEFNAMADTLHGALSSQHRCIAEIIHDMNSPLSRLGLAVEMVDATNQAQARELLNRIRRDSQRLSELSDRLLVLSRKSAGETGKPECFDVASLAEECVDSLVLEARKTGREIRATIPGQPLPLLGDKELVRRALENGLRNSLKYTPQGSDVHLVVSEEAGPGRSMAVVRISDHGPGVDPEEMDLIFQPFYRGANAEEHQGAGLGLAIVQRAVLAHQGEVHADNAPDQGFVLTMRFGLTHETGGAPTGPKVHEFVAKAAKRTLPGLTRQGSRETETPPSKRRISAHRLAS